jgi:CTP synthase (UTP-ammonia lyase)
VSGYAIDGDRVWPLCIGQRKCQFSEFDRSTANPVIDLMPDQQGITEKGGTMRLGLYPCVLQPGTIARKAYNKKTVEERHRHRFEFNNNYRALFTEKGMRFSVFLRMEDWSRLPNWLIIRSCWARNST